MKRTRSVGPLPPVRLSTVFAVLAASVVGLVAMMPGPAIAQSLFQSLFGFGSQPSPRMPSPHTYPPRSLPNVLGPGARGTFEAAPRTGGGYRTVCVRLCDGFYFPISNNVSRSQFTRDARTCQSSCGTEARLFYQPAGDSGADHLVDLTGRAYTSLSNAFRYRKQLVSGCACKALPWSEAEVARHQQYAEADAIAKGRPLPTRPQQQQQPATVVAGGDGPAVVGGVSGGATVAAPVIAGARDLVAERPSVAPMLADATEEGETADALPTPRARPKPIVIAQRAAPAPSALPAVTRPGAKSPVLPGTGPTKAPRPAGGSALGGPVYSHEQGRFLFPGEQRYR